MLSNPSTQYVITKACTGVHAALLLNCYLLHFFSPAKAQGKLAIWWDLNDKRYTVNYATMDSGSEYRILFTNYILLGALVTTALSPQDYRVADFKAAANDAFCMLLILGSICGCDAMQCCGHNL